MIGIPIGIATAHVLEWAIHKHVFHGLGKRKGSFFAFHFHEHHQTCRRNDMSDDMYRGSVLRWDASGKEAALLLAGGVATLPFLPIAPFFAITLMSCGARYYVLHRKAHLDPEWAKEHLPWHFDHHMGPDQDQNWGVTMAWVDRLMGTRVPYLGTERAQKDGLRKLARRVRAAA